MQYGTHRAGYVFRLLSYFPKPIPEEFGYVLRRTGAALSAPLYMSRQANKFKCDNYGQHYYLMVIIVKNRDN